MKEGRISDHAHELALSAFPQRFAIPWAWPMLAPMQMQVSRDAQRRIGGQRITSDIARRQRVSAFFKA